MCNYNIVSKEERKKYEKINMILNNLEQKLNKDSELCKAVANLIDMIVETYELVEHLDNIETKIPVIKQKINDLITSSISSCNQERKNVLMIIHEIILDNNENEKSKDYMSKIQKTIDYCVEEYPIYVKSSYYCKYHTSENKMSNISDLRMSDIIML